ncbi:MAG: hypothetical protein GY769_07670 [bacterium]|nr:hypothetical protein [bacterium]
MLAGNPKTSLSLYGTPMFAPRRLYTGIAKVVEYVRFRLEVAKECAFRLITH